MNSEERHLSFALLSYPYWYVKNSIVFVFWLRWRRDENIVDKFNLNIHIIFIHSFIHSFIFHSLLLVNEARKKISISFFLSQNNDFLNKRKKKVSFVFREYFLCEIFLFFSCLMNEFVKWIWNLFHPEKIYLTWLWCVDSFSPSSFCVKKNIWKWLMGVEKWCTNK